MVQINLGSADLIRKALQDGQSEAMKTLSDIGKTALRVVMNEPPYQPRDSRTVRESESVLDKSVSFLRFFDKNGLINTNCDHVNQILDSTTIGDASLNGILFSKTSPAPAPPKAYPKPKPKQEAKPKTEEKKEHGSAIE